MSLETTPSGHCTIRIIQVVVESYARTLIPVLRCQRVCKTWRAYLPGNDSTLRDKLFVKHTRIGDDENIANDSVCKIEERDHGKFLDKPWFGITLMTTGSVVLSPKCLPPRTSLPEFKERLNVEGLHIQLPLYHQLHPMLRDLDINMHVISKSLFRYDSGLPRNSFGVTTLDEFKSKTQTSKNKTEREYGPLKDMLLCVPPVPYVGISIRYLALGTYSARHYKYCAKSRDGVTIGQFAEAFREQWECLRPDIRLYQFNSWLFCKDCAEEQCCCGWDDDIITQRAWFYWEYIW